MSYAGTNSAAICVDGTTNAPKSGCAAVKGTVTTCKDLLGRYTVGSKYEYRYCKGVDSTV